MLTRFASDILFTTKQKKAYVWQLTQSGDLHVFAGSDSEEGNVDGPAKNCRFKQPIGICTEFDSVVYICDATLLKYAARCQSVPSFSRA